MLLMRLASQARDLQTIYAENDNNAGLAAARLTCANDCLPIRTGEAAASLTVLRVLAQNRPVVAVGRSFEFLSQQPSPDRYQHSKAKIARWKSRSMGSSNCPEPAAVTEYSGGRPIRL